jgi:C4-dicarboxylate transporter DctM subunit
MSLFIEGSIVIGLLLLMLFLGFGIGISLVIVALVGGTLELGFPASMNLLGTTSFNAIKDYVFAVVPLFVLMGLFASMAGAGEDLYNASNVLLKKVRGGMAMATVVANAIFAALTGATIASAAVFSKVSLPEMMRRGYDKKVASGTIAGSSVLGMLIPPSNLMIIYGMLTGESIGKLFIAGVLPGILLTTLYIIIIKGVAHYRPKSMGVGFDPERIEKTGSQEIISLWEAVLKLWPVVLLIVLVLGGIWGGLFTPTEAGGIGAFGTLLLAIFKKRFTWMKLWNALGDAAKTTGSILWLFIAAQMFSRMLATTGIISSVTGWIVSLGLAPIIVISIFCLLQILMGCILDATSILLLTIPLMVPVVRELGFDSIWYGIIAILTAEIGLITPPFGISVFTVKSSISESDIASTISVNDIFQGSYPFTFMMFVCLVLLVIFPVIVTLLPSLMLRRV